MPHKKRYLICLAVITFQLIGIHNTLGQEYYINEQSSANIIFIASGELATATTDEVEIIYNKNTQTVWLTFNVESFQIDNRKLRKKLFNKNKAKFTIKGTITRENSFSAGFGLMQFSFIGRIFNDIETTAVVASGRFSFSPEKMNQEYEFSLSCGIEPKWLGKKFADRSEFPAVNIHVIATILAPILGQKSASNN